MIELVGFRSPELAIVDIRMPPMQTWEGIDVVRAIRAEFPSVGILLLSAHIELETAIEPGQRREGVGYLLKDSVMTVVDIVDALEPIALGSSGYRSSPREGALRTAEPARSSRCTQARELEVLPLVARAEVKVQGAK